MSIPVIALGKNLITMFAAVFPIHIEMVLYPSKIKFHLYKNCSKNIQQKYSADSSAVKCVLMSFFSLNLLKLKTQNQ